MNLKIKDEKDFERIMDSLTNELVNVRSHYSLHCNLLDSIKDYAREMNNSPAFWITTLRANLDATLIGICRVYEQNTTLPYTINLRNLLDTIKENMNLFCVDKFRNRLKDNEYVDSLSQIDRRPDTTQIEKDIQYASLENELVKKLTIWRNNIIAHHSPTGVTRQLDFTKDYPLSRDDIMKLIDRAGTILNDYSYLYRASTTSWNLVGEDDYNFVLKSVKAELQRRKEEIQTEIARSK